MPDAAGHCPACGGLLRAGGRFCAHCGHDLALPVVSGAAAAHAPLGPSSRESSREFVERWGELKRLSWLFGLLLATSFVFGIAWRASRSPWLEVAISAIDALIVLVAVGLRWHKLRFLFRVRPTTLRGAATMVGIAILFVALGTGYFRLIAHLGVPMASATGIFRAAGWPLWSMFLLISVMPAVFEELAFRGVIQSSLERIFNARDAWLIQGALFSVLHLYPLMFPSHFLMGLCLGYMRRRSRSIYPGMLLHGSWNALVVLGELPR